MLHIPKQSTEVKERAESFSLNWPRQEEKSPYCEVGWARLLSCKKLLYYTMCAWNFKIIKIELMTTWINQYLRH